MSVSLFLFYDKYIDLCHILDSTYKWCHMVFVFLFLTYFTGMIICRSIHVSANGIILFLFHGWVVFHCVYIPYLLYPQNGCSWLRGGSPPSGESKTKAPYTLWVCQVQHVAVEALSCLHPVAEGERAWRFLCARSRSGTHPFCSHSIGQDWVIWLLPMTGDWKVWCSHVPRRRGCGVGKELASLYYTSFYFILTVIERERERLLFLS